MVPNSNKQVIVEKEAIMEQAMLNALAFAAIIGSPKDEISEGQAWKKYGKAWVQDRTERGNLHYNRSGAGNKSTKLYSRFEITCLKMAEKKIIDIYINAKRFIENEENKKSKK